MKKDCDYSSSNLAFWLQLDSWTVHEGLCLLCEIDPDGANVDWDGYKSPYGGWTNLPYLRGARVFREGKALGEARIMLELVSRLWDSGNHDQGRYPPSGFISWAAEKEIPVPWKRWAHAHGFLISGDISGDAAGTDLKHGGERTWPWGKHETKLLRKLADATEKFWKLYDPDDPSTAPTNQQVEKWLESEGVSKRVAEVMAQMLRADSLPPGPRK
jgi:hypothetical protein